METIQTERLILRPPVLEDADALLPIRNSDFVFAFNPMKPMNQAQMREALNKGRERTVVLEKKEDNTVIGAFFWSEDKLRYRVSALCLSYYLAQQESGKGYMTETLQKMTELLFLQGHRYSPFGVTKRISLRQRLPKKQDLFVRVVFDAPYWITAVCFTTIVSIR